MGELPSFTGAFILLALVSAVVGWGVIEGLIWIFSHISISIVQ